MTALTRREALARERRFVVAGALSRTNKASLESTEIDGIQVEGNPWHIARAKGGLHKWERIRDCLGGKTQSVITKGCGCDTKTIEVGCGQRECPRCRGAVAARMKRDIKRARIALRNEIVSRRLTKVLRERFVTLTAPHYDSAGAEYSPRRRVRILFEAWKIFGEWLRRHLREQAPEHADLIHSWRVWEWTEGDDGMGHPHFHLWIVSPWLDQDLLTEQWGRALARVSGEPRDVALVHIRAVRGHVEDELIKYMLKDWSDHEAGQLVSAPIVAHVLSEMYGRRRRQTSRGLSVWVAIGASKEKCFCENCGLKFDWNFKRTNILTFEAHAASNTS